MKTFTTVALTCCLIAVVALQAVMLRNQNRRESVIRYQPVDQAVPHLELVSHLPETGAVESSSTQSAPSVVSEEASSTGAIKLTMFAADDESARPAAFPETGTPLLELPGTEPAVAEAPLQFNANPFAEPEEPPAFDDLSAGQTAGDEEEKEPDPELAKYPIWLLIKPDGVQFLQTQEEIATHFHTIPPNAFLIGCRSATFEAGTVAQAEGEFEAENGSPERSFQLNCEDFTLQGRYGTKQNLEVTGDTLEFSTTSQQIRLQGNDERSLEFFSVDDSAENHMQADEIILQLREEGFQLSAKGASGVEINPIPAPKRQPKPKREPSGFDPFPANGA